jgi:hypothetical protein
MLRALATAALVLGSATTVGADEVEGRAHTDPSARCSEAAFTNIWLPGSAAVDEIQVIVASDSPETGAARVSVAAGRYDRVVSVLGNGTRGLKFSSPLQGTQFRVELDPVFEAPRSACVERILLLRSGTLVASVQP